MRKPLLWVAALVVVVAGAGGGYYGWTRLAAYSGEQFRAGLDQWIQTLPPGYAITYKTADYSVPTNVAKLGGVTIKATGAQVFDAAIDEVEVSKPSADFLAAWTQAAANPAEVAPEKAVPVAGAVTVKGVTFRSAAASVTLASMKVDGPRLYPWALLHSGVPSWTEAQASFAGRTQAPQLADFLPLIRFEAAIMLGIGYDAYTAENLQATGKMPATPTTPETEVTYSLRKLSGAGFDRGAFAGGGGEGFILQGAPFGTISVERVTMGAIGAQKPLTQLLSGEAPAQEMLDGITIGQIDYAGIKVQTPDGKEIPVGTVSISKIGFSHGVPISGELNYGGLKLSKALMPDPRAQEAFDKLGLETLSLSFGFSYQWDLDQKRIAIRNVVLKIDELGALNLSAELADMTPGEGWQARGSFTHAVLRYDDASLAERALKAAAEQANTDPAALRQQLIAMVDMRGAALGDSPQLAAAAKAVAAFVGAPHSLTVELAPLTPVAFSALQAAYALPPGDIATLLGLAVTANQ
jgi:hypothetical protein